MVAATVEELQQVDRWGASEWGAPRKLSQLVTGCVRQETQVHRVFTDVLRRELREQRGPTAERSASRPRVAWADADPFAMTLEQLAAATVHAVPCGACRGSGQAPCTRCGGHRFVGCSACSGSGKVRNPQTNRMNKCRACGASGRVGCRSCDARGVVGCGRCAASGHERAWLSYVESRRPRVLVLPESMAHAPFSEPRVLVAGDLAGMQVTAETHLAGALSVDALPSEVHATFVHHLADVHPQTERVLFQQYVGVVFTRSEVTFEMCGKSGSLMLLGERLRVVPTPSARIPIRRRWLLWPVVTVMLAIVLGVVLAASVGESGYFDDLRRVLAVTWMFAVAVSFPAIGALLRAWRPGWRVHPLRPAEWSTLAAWCVSLVVGLGCATVSQPSLAEARDALERGDVRHARVVLEGVREMEGSTAEVIATDDAISMVEVDSLVGASRLHRLDLIVAHGGPLADEASRRARADRLAMIAALIDAGSDVEAKAVIEEHFADARDEPDVSEALARIAEVEAVRCGDEACRIVALQRAIALADSPARTLAAQQRREQITSTLAQRCELGDPVLGQLGCVRVSMRVHELARQLLAHDELLGDDLQKTATDAVGWSEQLRATVPVLGANRDLLLALFPTLSDSPTHYPMVTLGEAQLYFVLDVAGVVSGVYVVGQPKHRQLDVSPWTAEQILAQVFGKPTPLVAPKKQAVDATKWKHAGVPIVARWRAGVVVELRVGDADV